MRLLAAAFVIVICADCVAQPTKSQSEENKYSLAELEAFAVGQHPAMAEATARIAAAQGRTTQAGMRANPRVGYVANEIGNEGSKGQHGAFISQTWVRGKKRLLDQSMAERDQQRLQHELELTRRQVIRQVRNRFYALLVLDRRIEITEYLSKINRDAAETKRKLAESGDALQLDATLFEIAWHKNEADLAALLSSRQPMIRELQAACGGQLTIDAVSGEIVRRIPEVTYGQALELVVDSNPSLAAAEAEIQIRRLALDRARANTVSNINIQTSLQHGDLSNDWFSGVQVGLPIRVHNNYRGLIQEAAANLQVATAQFERKRLQLESRLAKTFRQYRAESSRSRNYLETVLPRSLAALESATRLYQATELSFDEFVIIQRATAAIDLQFLDANDDAWSAYQTMMNLTVDNDK